MHFGPCYLGSKGLQQACNKLELKHSGGGSSREAPVRPRVRNLAEYPSHFCNISLGSCFAVREANEMCTFIAEYETLKYNKGNYLKSKLQIFIKMLAKRG